MRRIKMIIQYDGSHYHGFQMQLMAPTVQAALQQAVNSVNGVKTALLFASRTDAGVHALGQVIAFDTAAGIPAERWAQALNSRLPPDVRVLESQIAPASFHPRFDALLKHYRYRIYRRPAGAVCQRNYAWCRTETLDIAAMQKACGFLAGRQDFKSFCASGSAVKTFTRAITICRIREQGDHLFLDIAADGFLYHMVRIIMGTLMEIGRGRRPVAEMATIIARRDRRFAGPTAPPQGLYLMRVEY